MRKILLYPLIKNNIFMKTTLSQTYKKNSPYNTKINCLKIIHNNKK